MSERGWTSKYKNLNNYWSKSAESWYLFANAGQPTIWDILDQFSSKQINTILQTKTVWF